MACTVSANLAGGARLGRDEVNRVCKLLVVDVAARYAAPRQGFQQLQQLATPPHARRRRRFCLPYTLLSLLALYILLFIYVYSCHLWRWRCGGCCRLVHEFADSQFGHLFASGGDREAARRHMTVSIALYNRQGTV